MKKVVKRKRGRPRKDEHIVTTFSTRRLDLSICGPRTNVHKVLSVLESRDKKPFKYHMVFLDRHGWYCEDGPDCAAVKIAQQFDKKNPL